MTFTRKRSYNIENEKRGYRSRFRYTETSTETTVAFRNTFCSRDANDLTHVDLMEEDATKEEEWGDEKAELLLRARGSFPP